MCIMVDHWGENYSLCDIGPMPWGDGIVDVEDLIVLAEHLFEESPPIAHWKLDETEGLYAHDAVGENHAIVMGGPLWQPAGGQIDGAIQLDGVNDCLVTKSVLDPAEGPFSVLAWVRGGAPGQVIISQIGGLNWLCVDGEGNLMTELRYIGGRATEPPLVSQMPITDGTWHRIALTWDGVNRTLYVDGVEVAQDTHLAFVSSEGGLYLGTGSTMQPGSFFSGLIDDVRIYNRAVKP